MAISYTRDIDLGLKKFMKELAGAQSVDVVIGIQSQSVNEDGLDIATYGIANEFGDNKIPERSFMRSAWDENLSRITDNMQENLEEVKAGKSSFNLALHKVGLLVETLIKQKIGSNIQPANHPATIKAKGSSRTLIDTSAMLNSIRYVVRKK
jgi:hypothetical protein